MSIKKILTLLCAAVIGVSSALAVPAKRITHTMTQPDGTNVSLRQIGDEFFHCFITEDGYLVKKASDGSYKFIDNSRQISEIQASDPQHRSQQITEALKSLNPATTFDMMRQNAIDNSLMHKNYLKRTPAIKKAINDSKWDNADGHDIREFPTDGEQNVLVILVNFTDKKFALAEDPLKEMTNMMNEVGYSNFGATGSAYDFYTASSNNIFLPSFDVYGPVELQNKYSYYGGNDPKMGDQDRHPGDMVKEAIEALDDEIDYTNYDRNDDGFVDNVYVIYAGYGEADSGIDDTIWPHSYALEYALGAPITLDGVKINKYATSNELNYDDTPDGIGTFCHEFGHVLGLPDIYSTNYNYLAFSPGAYCTMDYGSYNNNGRTPPLFGTYEQYALEWLKPTEITEATTINMLPLSRNNIAYKISADASNPKEYFLFENRQWEGWDKFIPGHGMLVWHIDFKQSVWDSNACNNTADHQYIDIVEADNLASDETQASDPFPGYSNVYEFTSTTKPALKNWANKAINLPITEISESPDGIISFKVDGGGDENSPYYIASPAINNASVSPSSITLNWDKVANADGYRLTVYPFDAFDGQNLNEYVADYLAKDIEAVTSIEIGELTANTTYTVRIYAYNDTNMSSPCIYHISTSSDKFTDATPELTIRDIEDVTATASWNAIEDADKYLLTVATRTEEDAARTDVVTFDNKKLPSGWMTYGIWDSNEKYCGEAVPSIKLSFQGDLIETPAYDEEIKSFSFWCRTNRGKASIELQIFAKDGNKLTPITTITEVDGTAEGSLIEVKNIPGGVHQIAMYYYFKTSKLEFNIDDIKVELSGGYTDTPIAGFDRLELTETSAAITGLQKLTDYVAYVEAVGSAGNSKKSYAVKFTTKNESSVESIETANNQVFAINNGLIIPTDQTIAYNVYTIDGRTIAQNKIGTFQLPAKGIYIIKNLHNTAKICW